MANPLKHALLCWWLQVCCAALFLQAQATTPGQLVTYRLLALEDGLPSREVICGLQDSRGFIWLGTADGLCKYDGERVTSFNTLNSAVRADRVVELTQDNDGRIWILYSENFTRKAMGMVDVIDVRSHKVQSFSNCFKNAPFKEASISSISQYAGGIYIYLTNGDYYQYSNGSFKKAGYIAGWTPVNTFGAIHYNRVWIGDVDMRAVWLNAEGKEISRFSSDNKMLLQLNRNGKLLAAGITGNLNWFELDSLGKVTPATLNINNEYARAAFTGYFDVIRNPLYAPVIIYNVAGGIFLFDEGALTPLITGAEMKKLEGLVVFNFFKDGSGNYWLCTNLGVIQISATPNKFAHYKGVLPAGKSELMQSQVRGVYADSSGNVWAIQNSSIFKFNKNGEQQILLNGSGGLFGLTVYNGRIYFTGKSLYSMPLEGGRIDTLGMPPGFIEIWAAMPVSGNRFLLGGRNGLLLCHVDRKEMQEIKPAAGAEAVGWVMDLVTTRDGKVWALADNGVYLLDNNYSTAKQIEPRTNNSVQRKPFTQLLDGYEDANGVFWMGTRGKGLIRWNRRANEVKRFTTDDGLSSNTIYRIEQDEKGLLWLSSDYGLMRFDTGTFALKVYTIKDGLAQNEFDRPSSYRAADGLMVFGGVNGTNTFYPHNFWTDSGKVAPLQVVSFQQYNEKLNDLTGELLAQNKIVVTPNDKFFILQFALLDFDYNSKQRYAYKIEGVDANWNFIDENSIRISGLPAGEHVLYIRAQNQSGRWAASELKIPVTVIEPLLQRTWFRIALALALFALVFAFIRYRTYRLTKAKQELEQTVSMRTEQMSKLLGEKDVLLKEIHHRVKNNLQIISNLLDMQGNRQNDEQTQRAFDEAKARVRAVALIHQNLYQQNNLSGIDLHHFVNELIALTEQLFKPMGKNIQVKNHVLPTYLDIDTAVPLGLILNELLTNAYKYAFNQTTTGTITIQLLEPTPGNYQLVFTDSGPGLANTAALENAGTLGLRLIKLLAAQLMGHIAYTYQNGSCFTIHFKGLEARKAVK